MFHRWGSTQSLLKHNIQSRSCRSHYEFTVQYILHFILPQCRTCQTLTSIIASRSSWVLGQCESFCKRLCHRPPSSIWWPARCQGRQLAFLVCSAHFFFVLAIFAINQYKYKHSLHNNHESSEYCFPHFVEGFIRITAQIP